MPRDFDIRKNVNSSPPPRSYQQSLTASPVTDSHDHQSNTLKPAKKPQEQKHLLPVLIAIIGLAAAAVGTYYWSTLPIKETTTNPTSDTTTSSPATESTDQKNVFQGGSEPVINFYQSGAPTEAISQITTLLKEKGYQVENLGDSQFEYDKTYIWYRAEFEAQAKTIGSLLANRVISYKESQNAGLFDVLIYLGKQ